MGVPRVTTEPGSLVRRVVPPSLRREVVVELWMLATLAWASVLVGMVIMFEVAA